MLPRVWRRQNMRETEIAPTFLRLFERNMRIRLRPYATRADRTASVGRLQLPIDAQPRTSYWHYNPGGDSILHCCKASTGSQLKRANAWVLSSTSTTSG